METPTVIVAYPGGTVTLLDQFKQTLTNVSPATRVAYLTDAHQHLQWLRYHDETPTTINQSVLSLYPAYLCQRYQPATVARKLCAIRRFYDALHIDPGDALQTPAAPHGVSNPTPWDELPLPQLADATGRGFRDRAILALSILHHLPATSISRLTWPDLDIEKTPGLLRHRGDLVILKARAYRCLTGWQRATAMLQIESNHVFVTLHNGRRPLSARGVRAVINKYQGESDR